MILELFAGAAIVLFALIQIIMTVLSWKYYARLQTWKNSLSNSQSILAKLELIIFF